MYIWTFALASIIYSFFTFALPEYAHNCQPPDPPVGDRRLAFLLPPRGGDGTPVGKRPIWSAGDSLTFYFPQNQNPGLGFQYTNIDTSIESWYSSTLFSFREPVLYGHYSESGIYRFLWLRSFDPPVVFVLSRLGGQVTLATKVLDQQPEFDEFKYKGMGWKGLPGELKGRTIERFGDPLIVVKADRRAGIVFNRSKRLTGAE